MRIDKREVERRFRRSMESYEDNAVIQKRIADRLSVLVQEYVETAPSHILEIGCGTGMLTGLIRRQCPDAKLWINDLVAEMCWQTAERYAIPAECCLPGDAETIAFSASFDLIVSASTFQWFVDLEAMLDKLNEALRQDGVLVFSTFGERNMLEIRMVSGHGLSCPDLQTVERLLAARFDVLHATEESHVMDFATPLDVLCHLKRTGVNASHTSEQWTRGKVQAFSRAFSERFGADGRVPLTYHPMYFVCKKRKM